MGIVMIRESDLSKLETLIKKCGSDYETWRVLPKDEEIKRLQLNKS